MTTIFIQASKELKISRDANNDESEEDINEVKEVLAELKELAQQNNGTFPDGKVLEYIKEQIKSMPCRNQGYVLDGFPNKLADAKDIFKCIYFYFEKFNF